MVAAYRDLRDDSTLLAAADAILALRGITMPSRDQQLGAMLDAEFKIRVIRFLTKG